MPKSKNRKGHDSKVRKYNENKKVQQEILKKKMMENYIKLQQEIMAGQAHTSTEDAIDSDINIDELNTIDDISLIDIDNLSVIPEVVEESIISPESVEIVDAELVDTNK